MEIPMDSYTPEQYEELSQVQKSNLCGICGAELTIHTVPERKVLEVGCSQDKEHKGFQQRESYTQMMRRGATAPDLLVDAMKKRMLPKDMTPEDFQRTLNRIQVKYPDIGRDLPTAALFLLDAVRLNLDPLLGEIVPLVFNKDKPKPTVVPFITEAGTLSGAARACQEDWNGPPTVMPLQDYLLTLSHLEDRPLSEIKELVEDTAENLTKDRKARVWVAIGRRKSDSRDVKELAPAYGWFTSRDLEEAETRGTPSGAMPGNQARIRAVRRWANETYPEWRQKMIVLTGEWQERSAGVLQARKVIEAEYQLSDGNQNGGTESSHMCKVHNVAFFKRRNMRNYAHPYKGPNGEDLWCNESPETLQQKPAQSPDLDAPQEESQETKLDREMILTSAKALKSKGWDNKKVWDVVWGILGSRDVKKLEEIPADKVRAVASHLAELKDIA